MRSTSQTGPLKCRVKFLRIIFTMNALKIVTRTPPEELELTPSLSLHQISSPSPLWSEITRTDPRNFRPVPSVGRHCSKIRDRCAENVCALTRRSIILRLPSQEKQLSLCQLFFEMPPSFFFVLNTLRYSLSESKLGAPMERLRGDDSYLE